MTEKTTGTVGAPIIWRLSLSSSPERVFELLDTDDGRERFWAVGSHPVPRGFDLEFPGGLKGRVEVVEKAAADFDIDLRNGSPERTWEQRYVDQ